MILPDFVLPSRVNQTWSYSGLDCIEDCLDKKHFKSYPHDITYNYNSRGFRDLEWPSTIAKLKNSIWCVGDSFTVGVGSPFLHIWPCILQQTLDTRTINVSMDGASNMWIARKAVKILQDIAPAVMVIHWSYINRREQDMPTALDQQWKKFYNNIRDPSWPDCDRHELEQLPQHIIDEIELVHGGWNNVVLPDDRRLMHYFLCSVEDDISNTLDCINLVSQSAQHTRIVHSFIPNFVPDLFKGHIESMISGLVIPEIKPLDLARDGHHYDQLTSHYLVEQILLLLNQ
jgi:hypothetical protein